MSRVATGKGGKSRDATRFRVEIMPITAVVPYARNPRKNAPAVAKVAASIREFGFRQPIVVDRENVIVAGHTRLLAALHLGLREVPVHVAENLTPAQVKAYRLADNRVGQEATWDQDSLGLEFADLEGLDFDLKLTGFSEGELRALGIGVEAVGLPDLALGDKAPFEQMTFTLHTSQADVVREALDVVKAVGGFVDSPNENSNGNALARLAEMALGALG